MKGNHFKFKFTKQQVRDLLHGNSEADEWYEAMYETLPKWNIDTVERVAGFIAQCAHESNNFRTLEENLNYSWQSLMRVFGRYFPTADKAKEYHRKPKQIANYVYMDEHRTKKGALGNVKPGDGWLFRGRGLKQLTGRNNYAAFGKTIGMTAEEAAEYVATKKGAIESACWFWDTNNLNQFADKKDIEGMSRRINGGTIGLDDRIQRWHRALQVLGGKRVQEDTNTIIRRGSEGVLVKRVQEALGISSDGIFGPGTERALKEWQSKNGLVADGIAGPKTLEKLL